MYTDSDRDLELQEGACAASIRQGEPASTMGSSARQVPTSCQAWLCNETPYGLSGRASAIRKSAQPAFAPVRAGTSFLQQVPSPGPSNGFSRLNLRVAGCQGLAILVVRAGRRQLLPSGAPQGDDQSHQGSVPIGGAKKGSTRMVTASGLSEMVASNCVAKICTQCQRSKSLVDFEMTVATVDGRTDECRACLAVVRAKRARKDLHHLALRVEESWERAKPCTKCGLVKEFRDFSWDAKTKDGTYSYCRACHSSQTLTRRRTVPRRPTEEPQQCSACLDVKEADHFYPDIGRLNGRKSVRKDCHSKEKVERYHRAKEAPVHTWKATRRCRTCQQEKPRSDFYKHPPSIDGLVDRCIACVQVYYRSQAKMKRREHLDGRDLSGGSRADSLALEGPFD